jgi:hypothetical protein
MKRSAVGSSVIAALVVLACAQASQARGNDYVITDGQGEGVQIKHGFFGKKSVVVKDRMGDGFATKKGWFGTKETEANVLGNSFHKKKGLLGGSTIEGHTILGDTVSTKKGIFGRSTTTIDASGVSNLIRGLLKDDMPKPSRASGLSSRPDASIDGRANIDPLDQDVMKDPQ